MSCEDGTTITVVTATVNIDDTYAYEQRVTTTPVIDLHIDYRACIKSFNE